MELMNRLYIVGCCWPHSDESMTMLAERDAEVIKQCKQEEESRRTRMARVCDPEFGSQTLGLRIRRDSSSSLYCLMTSASLSASIAVGRSNRYRRNFSSDMAASKHILSRET